MKSIFVTLSLLVAASSASADLLNVEQTKADLAKVEFKCTSFKIGGLPLLGISAPQIVSIPDDSTGKTSTLFVRTSPVVPNPVINDEKLTKTFQGVDASLWETESFKVNMFFVGGMHASIQKRNSKAIANCVHATIK